MKILKFYQLIALGMSLLTLMAANASAANMPRNARSTYGHNTGSDGEWYVGAGLGIANVKDMCPSNSFASDCDDSGGALRVFGGMQINPFFALEASLDLNGDYQAPGARAAGYDGSTSSYFFGLNAIGFLPVAPRLSLYGGVSGAFSYVSVDVTERRYHNGSYSTCYYDGYDSYNGWYYYCTNDRYDDRRYRSDSSAVAGALVGVDVKVADRFHVRAQAQRYFNVESDLGFGGHSDVDQFTVNGLFMFR